MIPESTRMAMTDLNSPGEGLEGAHDGSLQLQGDGLAQLVRNLSRHILTTARRLPYST
jgi:hypothetical protein